MVRVRMHQGWKGSAVQGRWGWRMQGDEGMRAPTGNLQHTEAGFSFALVYPPKMTVKGLAWH